MFAVLMPMKMALFQWIQKKPAFQSAHFPQTEFFAGVVFGETSRQVLLHYSGNLSVRTVFTGCLRVARRSAKAVYYSNGFQSALLASG